MASPMEVFNASQTTVPDSVYATISSSQTGLMSKFLENTSTFSIIVTLLALAIAYDQGIFCHVRCYPVCVLPANHDLQSRTGRLRPILLAIGSRYPSLDHSSKA